MLRLLTGQAPIANLKPVRAHDYSVEVQRTGPASLPAIYHNFHMVAVTLSGEHDVVRESPQGGHRACFSPGDSSLHAAGPGQRVTWPDGVHCLYVHLHPRLIRRIGERVLHVSHLAPQTRFRLRDPIIADIGFELQRLLDAGAPIDGRAAHGLVMALAHHVIASYAAPAAPSMRVGALRVEEILDVFRDDMPNWEGVASMAARCGLSRSHFSRRIHALVGMSPYAMVLGSRVEAAKNLLESREASLSEVAYATGFADQSHLTRVFLRATGVTPARYRTGAAARR